MFVDGLGTAVPSDRYTQRECFETSEASRQYGSLMPRSQAILRKVLLGDNGIATRHLAIRPLADAFYLDPDSLHARFERHAPALATEAAERALMDAGRAPGDIDAVIISTCTGYLCPGLTSYVAERLGLRGGVFALDLVGQGCGAAIPNWRTADALLSSGRAGRVLSVCVEVCSAAFYLDDDPGVLVSACLFGDGAGAAVLSREGVRGKRLVEWVTAASVLRPAQRDQLRFEHRAGMLRNVLSLEVPSLAADAVEQTLDQALAQAAISRRDIRGWILHPGGRDVLNAVRRRLDLDVDDLRFSAEVLRKYGNLSSASVYFALENALADGAPDGWWWLCSFGAGFSCHGALLEVSATDSRI